MMSLGLLRYCSDDYSSWYCDCGWRMKLNAVGRRRPQGGDQAACDRRLLLLLPLPREVTFWLVPKMPAKPVAMRSMLGGMF